MQTIDAIKSRRSVRAWTNQDVPEEIVLQILESGRWSPSPLNFQPWHFIVIRDKHIIENLCKYAHEAAYLRSANVCIVITVNKNNSLSNDPSEHHAFIVKWLEEHDQFIYSASCALQNMWLTAWDIGIGGVWVTIDDPTSREILNIPQDQVVIGSLALGYPLGNPVPHRDMDRKPLSELVFREKYGQK